MKLDDLTIGEAKQLAALFGGGATTVPARDIGEYVVVRTYSAGVHVGVLDSRSGQEVVLSDPRRIWKWTGANTLHEISLRGVGSDSRVSEQVESVTLTQAIEVLRCTSEAEKNLRGAKWTK